MKRILFLTHRWGGIALALIMVLWFSSGLVIIFAEPPTPTRAQLLAHAEQLRPEAGWLSAGEAWDASEKERSEFLRLHAPAKQKPTGTSSPAPGMDTFVDARLVRRGGEALWVFEDARGQRLAVSAARGALHSTTPDQAVAIARGWASHDDAVAYVETVDKPAILRNQEALRPFHRIAIGNGSGGELLVSARTGEVVHASTRLQRALFWVGNWVHLFRPLELAGATNDTRVEVLKWTGFLALLSSLTGLIVGWIRWRPGWFGQPTYPGRRTQPYRERWLTWHFWTGLVGGTFAFAWALSGFLSNNPWQLFSPATPSRDELARYFGNEAPTLARAWRPASLVEEVEKDGDVVELNWRRLGDTEVLAAYTSDGRRPPLSREGASRAFDEYALAEAVGRIASGASIAAQSVLSEYDAYYYLRHHRDVADRPLPVVRVELGDAAGTRFYLDPQDGRLLLKTDHRRAVYRWAYSALHHWDFGWLYQRPVWFGWMLLLVGLGLVMSVSSVVIGWRRLRLTVSPKRAKPATPPLGLSAEGHEQLEG